MSNILDEDNSLEHIAAKWFLKSMGEMSNDEKTEFEQWIAYPEHHKIFKEMGGTWQKIATAKNSIKCAGRTINRRNFLYGVAASVLASVGGYYMYKYYLDAPFFSGEYYSKKGEILNVTLQDGSVLSLDADSAIEVKFTQNERLCRLVRGQAMFAVAKDENKVFKVYASSSVIKVVGTKFAVRNIDGDIGVDVQEGHVKVYSMSDEQYVLADLRLCESAKFAKNGSLKQKNTIDPNAIAPWIHGRVEFENATLKFVLSEFGRYGGKGLVASKEAEDMRISGSFDIKHADKFANALALAIPVRFEKKDGYTLILPK